MSIKNADELIDLFKNKLNKPSLKKDVQILKESIKIIYEDKNSNNEIKEKALLSLQYLQEKTEN